MLNSQRTTAIRWLGLLGLGLLTNPFLMAQSLRDFPYVDSLSATLAGEGRWMTLDSLGKAALRAGTDYPVLRQRLGYAALQRGQLAAAIRHYGQAVAANPADDDSRSQLALAYLYFNQPAAARLVVRPFPDSVRYLYQLPSFQAVTQAWVEGGVKGPARARRGAAGYGQLGVSTQLSTQITLTQQVVYYGQQVQLPERGRLASSAIRQGEYSTLFTTQLSLPLQLKAAYHTLYNSFGERRYGSHLGFLALQYSRPVWAVQGGGYAGHVSGSFRSQADLQLTVYPLGNLTFYGFGRGSLIRSGGTTYPNSLLGAGGRILPKFWLEGFWSPGRTPVLVEHDGTTVYNLLDPLDRRFGASAYYFLSTHWRLHLYYVGARYQQTNLPTFYTQHSLTSGLTWTW